MSAIIKLQHAYRWQAKYKDFYDGFNRRRPERPTPEAKETWLILKHQLDKASQTVTEREQKLLATIKEWSKRETDQ